MIRENKNNNAEKEEFFFTILVECFGGVKLFINPNVYKH